MSQPFYILGHRGTRNSQFYQNSPSAFREALTAADGLETDAVLSSDGVVFLVHDVFFLHQLDYTLAEHLEEASAKKAGNRRIDQIPASEIAGFLLKNGEPMMRLDELLEKGRNYPEAIFNIELKADNTALPVLECTRRAVSTGYIRREQVIMSSHNRPELAVVRKAAPDIKIGLEFAMETQQQASMYPWSDNTGSCYVPFDRTKLDDPLIREINPDYFNLALPTTSLPNIATIHAAYPKAQLMIWTMDEPAPEEVPTILRQLQHLSDDGLLHSWITDEPRLRKAALRDS